MDDDPGSARLEDCGLFSDSDSDGFESLDNVNSGNSLRALLGSAEDPNVGRLAVEQTASLSNLPGAFLPVPEWANMSQADRDTFDYLFNSRMLNATRDIWSAGPRLPWEYGYAASVLGPQSWLPVGVTEHLAF